MRNDFELFFESIRLGNKYRLEALLGINPKLVDATDSRGFTPLILATYFDNEVASKILIKHNADIEAKDSLGNTALIGVSFKGNVNLASLLIKEGANINACNNEGITPLIIASQYENENIIQLFIEKGADITIKDNKGKTAYDYALEKNYTHLLEKLKTE